MRRRVGQSSIPFAPFAVWSAVVAGAFTLVASACGATVPSTSAAVCRNNADCREGYSCLFSTFGSCGMFGSCLANPDGTACDEQLACGCSGALTQVCLVNGNSPTPIETVGTCDGASLQQGYDANATTTDDAPAADTQAPPVDASEASVVTTPDSSPIVDANPPVDSADATPTVTFGSACNTNAQCTDPNYDQCGPLGTCTKLCQKDSDCPEPPTTRTCDFEGFCE